MENYKKKGAHLAWRLAYSNIQKHMTTNQQALLWNKEKVTTYLSSSSSPDHKVTHSLHIRKRWLLTQKMLLCLFIHFQHQETIWSRILRQTGNATSCIKSCQNQTKTARFFKTAKRRVYMKFQAILTLFGLTSLFQQLNGCSPWL